MVRHGLSRYSYARRKVEEIDPGTGEVVTVTRVLEVTGDVGLFPADKINQDLGPM